MKKLNSLLGVSVALLLPLVASAAEVSSVECKYDHRSTDGDAAVMSVMLRDDGKHDFSLEITPSGRGGGKKFSSFIDEMECSFSERIAGVFSCVLSGDRFEEQQQVIVSYEVHPFMGETLTATVRYIEAAKAGRKLGEKVTDFRPEDCTVSRK